MATYRQMIDAALREVPELFPWDLVERRARGYTPMILDVREPEEFRAMHIEGSLNAPRGILEQCCEWDFEETIPVLVRARDESIVVVCRSGNRSVLAASAMKALGYRDVVSLKTGLRGWNDYELPLIDRSGRAVPLDDADAYFDPRVRPEQRRPK